MAAASFLPLLALALPLLRMPVGVAGGGLQTWGPNRVITNRRCHPAPRLQVGPLEDGFKELIPQLNQNKQGDVEAEIVARVNDEVLQLTGVELESLLNPSKVVNGERKKLIIINQLDATTSAEEKAQLQLELDKLDEELFREKRTVFREWLKALFVGQAILGIIGSGFLAYDAFPGASIDLSLRALGFWSFWLFTIPSLRARRPRGWEKKALNIAFLGSPILTLGLPFVTKQPDQIWLANLVLLVGSYVYGYISGPEDEEVGGFSGALRWLDFGSGQERGMRAEQREAFFERRTSEEAAESDSSDVTPK